MSNQISNSLEFFIVTLSELALLFIIISFVVSLLNHKFPPEKIKRLLSGNKGYGIAVSLGSVTPFCSCSTLPMTIGLIQAKAAFGPIMAFLFTSPLLNPFIVGLFWVSFGARVTLIYSAFVVILSILSGAILQRLNFERFIRKDIYKNSNQSKHSQPSIPKRSSEAGQCSGINEALPIVNTLNWKKTLLETFQQFRSFAPYMVLGVMIGAILHGYVPASAFVNLAGKNLFLIIPVSAIVGVFLYVRASTMVPIASALLAKGMTMGAVMSLTIAGAGASLPEMIIMRKMFHWPLLAAFIIVVFTTACVTGFAIEWL
jgi:uncharacterized protein